MASAQQLKEQGNRAFQKGELKEAKALYTRAIQNDPHNSALFTNRALTHIKLQAWDSCLDDCMSAMRIDVSSFKAFYYLAIAQLSLNHPNEAYSSALKAYELCLDSSSQHASSISSVISLVLKSKKMRWECAEDERIRRNNDLLREMEDYIEVTRLKEISCLQLRLQNGDLLNDDDVLVEKARISDEAKTKISDLRSVFAIADPANCARREVPDYVIDHISFAVMHDPVITTSGQSYERATILEHLKTKSNDPLTREPLKKEQLVSNIALREVCEEFLEKNGWAVDW
ncbi:hypothetical protein MMC25_006818 [Agyrium rufum]|nr:hypothetical protein [Agyrium rufum]